MFQDVLNRILIIVIVVNVFALGVLVVFLINFHINIRRRVAERKFSLRLLDTVKKSETKEQAAQDMNLTVQEITQFCMSRGIELPESRLARIEAIKRQKEEENRRILEEEATWRAEQERNAEARQREKEIDLKKRKERLRKFGIS